MQNIKQDPIRFVRILMITYFISYILFSVISRIAFINSITDIATTQPKFFDIGVLMQDIRNLISPILFAVCVFAYYGSGKGKYFLIGAYTVSLYASVRSCIAILGIISDFSSLLLGQNTANFIITAIEAVLFLLLLICSIRGEKGIKTAKTVVVLQLGHCILRLIYTLVLYFMLSDLVGFYSVVIMIKGIVVPLLLITAYFIYWRYAANKERELISDSGEKTVAL